MKPLHVGLLVIGAALAGGLAVRLSQVPAPVPAQIPRPAAVRAPEAAPDPVQPVVEASMVKAPVVDAVAPPPVYTPESKPAAVRKPGLPAPAPVSAAAPLPSPAPVPAPIPYTPPVPEPGPASPQPPPAAPIQPPPAPNRVTLNAGTQVVVRLDQGLSSDHVSVGDTFQASLAEPLLGHTDSGEGFVIAERGARVSGRVVDTRKAGRLSGISEIQLALSTIQTSDGQKIAVSTEPWSKQGESPGNQNVAKIGGGAALGAIIGAIVGGGKGAAIGAGAGGALGTGAAAATGAKPVSIPSETVIQFRLANRVSVTEKLL